MRAGLRGAAIWLATLLQSRYAWTLRTRPAGDDAIQQHLLRSANLRRHAHGETPYANVSRALSCLQQTTPGLKLKYPKDAEEHMEKIRKAMEQFQPNYIYGERTGKHIDVHVEHTWMFTYKIWQRQKRDGAVLSDVFGPYIPIFTHWVEPWFEQRGPKKKKGRFWYPEGFIPTLRSVLRKDVPYIVMSQNDEGLSGKDHDHFHMRDIPNVVVFSAGGYGHVPVPLWSCIPKEYTETFFVPPGPRPHRTYLLNYVGSLIHAPGDMRAAMKETIEQYAANHSLVVAQSPDNETFAELEARNYSRQYSKEARLKLSLLAPDAVASNKIVFFHNKSNDAKKIWQEIMLTSRFSLAPRGFGRTSYHLSEIMLSGGIPVHVYTDVPWVPYQKVYEQFGFYTDVAGLPALLDRLRSMPAEEFHAREELARKVAQSHWMEEGLTQQLFRFMLGHDLYTGEATDGDLICGKLPATKT